MSGTFYLGSNISIQPFSLFRIYHLFYLKNDRVILYISIILVFCLFFSVFFFFFLPPLSVHLTH